MSRCVMPFLFCFVVFSGLLRLAVYCLSFFSLQ